MTDKERVNNTLEGKPVDRMPVSVLYSNLYFQDHFVELTGRSPLELLRWLYSEPVEYLKVYKELIEKVPFEILEPHSSPPYKVRNNIEFIEKNGKVFSYRKKEGTFQPVKLSKGHAFESVSNEEQKVFDKEDVKRIKIVKAEELIQNYDYARILIQELGSTHFIITTGLTGILWQCHHYLGQTKTLMMLVENPSLIDYLSNKLIEQLIEYIKAACSVGGDAIFIDDAMAYSDVISKKHCERFVFPYTKKMVETIHHFSHKVILIYFGGVMDRLDLIAETGADALACETSMKGYINDICQIAEAIGSKMALFGNIDPIGILQNGTDEQMEKEIRRQVEAGRKARGFIISTGSPITPYTNILRVQKFIELSRRYGRYK